MMKTMMTTTVMNKDNGRGEGEWRGGEHYATIKQRITTRTMMISRTTTRTTLKTRTRTKITHLVPSQSPRKIAADAAAAAIAFIIGGVCFFRGTDGGDVRSGEDGLRYCRGRKCVVYFHNDALHKKKKTKVQRTTTARNNV